MRKQVVRGVALLMTVVGMLTVGIVGPESVTLEAFVSAATALGTASQSASPAPLVAGGLLVGGLLLAVSTEFGPFGPIDASRNRKTATCRVCEHRIDESQTECPYCNTSEPVDRE